MKIKIDTYYDITCQNCGKSWSTDFNANTKQMTDGGMGMATSKQWLSKTAYKAGWKCKNGQTLCPECVETFREPKICDHNCSLYIERHQGGTPGMGWCRKKKDGAFPEFIGTDKDIRDGKCLCIVQDK